MSTLKNMAIAIIAIVFAIVLPSSKVDGQNLTTTDTISTTFTAGKIDGFRWSENYHGRTQLAKIPGELQISLDVSFLSPITLRYDTINGGSNGTITDSLTSPFLAPGPKQGWVRRVWRDSTGAKYSKVVAFTTLVNPLVPVINFITVANQINANTVLSGLSIKTNTKTYYKAFISVDSIVWIGVGNVDTIYANGMQTFMIVDSLKGPYNNWYIRYCAWNEAGADSTNITQILSYPSPAPFIEVDSANEVGNSDSIDVFMRCVTYNSTTNIKVVFDIGDTLFATLAAHNGVQSLKVTKANAVRGKTYTVFAIAKNATGMGLSSKLVQITLPIDLAVTGFSATPSTMSAQIKFKPEVPVGKVANFSVDIAKDSSFVNVVQSKAFSGMNSSSQIQSTIFSLDTGVYYARVQGYITPANGQYVKQVVSFTVKATPTTGISEIDLREIVVYPNPATNVLNVPSLFGPYEVLNSLGQIIKTISTDSQIDVSEFPSGIYFIRSEKVTKKFLKQ